MKHLFLLTLTVLTLQSAFAQEELTNNFTDSSIYPLGSTIDPLYASSTYLMCANERRYQDEISCIFELVTYGPISTVTLLALVMLKEDFQQVGPDAYQYLAGEGKTLALSSLMDKLREEHAELRNRSDRELIALIIDVSRLEVIEE